MSDIIHKLNIPAERKGLRLLWAVRRNLLSYFVNLMNKEGPFAWLSLGGRNVLMLNDALGIQHVLKDNAENYHKSYFYKVLRPLLGDSILLSEGKLWRKQRQEASPVFTTRNFEPMISPMVEATETMLRRWKPKVDRGEPIDLNFETMWFTLDILLRTLFHQAREDIALNMQAAITTMLREAEERIWWPGLPQTITFQLPKYKSALDFLDSTIQELIDCRRASKAYPEDLLSRLIAGYGSSAEDVKMLRDQVMTFLLAGHETTANGLVWACYYLSLHPEILQKMAREADGILSDEPLTLNGVREFNYTTQVFNEVLRIRPIVWTLSRDAQAEDHIPLEDGSCVHVPKDTVIMMCAYAVHRRSNYWSNPEAFNPERFNPEIEATRHKFSYFPFGGGSRLCLGFRFAQIESIIALAMIAQRYELSLVPGQDIQHLPNITLRPNGPIYFHLTERGTHTVPLAIKSAGNEQAAASRCPFH